MQYLHLPLTFFLGALLWTLSEYLLHRFLGHLKLRPLIRTRFHKEHTKHHLKRDYFVGAIDKFLTLLATTPGLFLLANFIAGPVNALSFTLGFTSMYLAYEVIHLRMHQKAPPHIYASRMRAHHFYHHFVNEKMNHGVTTPFWDLVFSTYQRPGIIALPRKFQLPWMELSSSERYQDPYGQSYRIGENA